MTTIDTALSRVRRAPSVLDAARAADDLVDAAAADGRERGTGLLVQAALDESDTVTAIAAVHALGAVADTGADAMLSDLLSHPRPFLREHAAQALASRLPNLHAVGRLVAAVVAGGFGGALAQRTLQRWAADAPEHVALALEGALAAGHERTSRARLVEALGLVPGSLATRALLRIAADETEEREARQAAVAAVGDRLAPSRSAAAFPSSAFPSSAQAAQLPARAVASALALLRSLAASDGDLAGTAALALLDAEPPPPRHAAARGEADEPGAAGLTVAQLYLHADLDRGLTRAGTGDTGGVATLLVRLGDALAAEPGVARVLTLSRGTTEQALAALTGPAESSAHHLVPVPLGVGGSADGRPLPMASAWPLQVAAERGIRRALTLLGPVDVLHLRMADVGSAVAARVAADLGIPTVFTVAPDPHAVIAALEATGALTRAGFGEADEREHFWSRLRLVRRLTEGAAHGILFPRPRLREELTALLGTDLLAPGAGAVTVVPEGIDLAVTRAARGSASPDLEPLLATLPPHRRDLPLLLSVGRLHRVKGMATVVEAWASGEELRERANLLIVGGDLAAPTPDEAGQVERIDAALAERGLTRSDGVLLAGHRPHDVVARWMEAARRSGGAYVCGSIKEEFGLAIVESLAAGLVVVAPGGGGPATYVEDGETGVLVDTRDPADVAHGMTAALDLVAAPQRPALAARAQAMVEERFTVQAMARALVGVYAGVSDGPDTGFDTDDAAAAPVRA